MLKIKNREDIVLNHHQYLSKLTLGTIIRTIRNEKLQNQVMSLKQIKFKDYDLNNREYFYKENKKLYFNNINKVDIVLSLLHNLRNRCYHWENIKKLRQRNNAYFPRLTTKIGGTFIGIHPCKLEVFLCDLIRTFNEDLLNFLDKK